jgi:hypothetical protein
VRKETAAGEGRGLPAKFAASQSPTGPAHLGPVRPPAIRHRPPACSRITTEEWDQCRPPPGELAPTQWAHRGILQQPSIARSFRSLPSHALCAMNCGHLSMPVCQLMSNRRWEPGLQQDRSRLAFVVGL